jgi:hypothetical protein
MTKIKPHEINESDLHFRLPKGMRARKPHPLHTLRLRSIGIHMPTVTPSLQNRCSSGPSPSPSVTSINFSILGLAPEIRE